MMSFEFVLICDEFVFYLVLIIVVEKRERFFEKERMFVNEVEKNGLVVGMFVMMVLVSMGMDDLKCKKWCLRWI